MSKDKCKDGNGHCWFPYTKTDFPHQTVHFKNQQILKMIRQSHKPNKIDGCWFLAEKVAGPFGKVY